VEKLFRYDSSQTSTEGRVWKDTSRKKEECRTDVEHLRQTSSTVNERGGGGPVSYQDAGQDYSKEKTTCPL